MVKYNNTDTVSLLQEWITKLDGMFTALRKDTSSEAAKSRLSNLYDIEVY